MRIDRAFKNFSDLVVAVLISKADSIFWFPNTTNNSIDWASRLLIKSNFLVKLLFFFIKSILRTKTAGLKYLNGYHDLRKIFEIDFVVSPKQTFPTATEDTSSGYWIDAVSVRKRVQHTFQIVYIQRKLRVRLDWMLNTSFVTHEIRS